MCSMIILENKQKSLCLNLSTDSVKFALQLLTVVIEHAFLLYDSGTVTIIHSRLAFENTSVSVYSECTEYRLDFHHYL